MINSYKIYYDDSFVLVSNDREQMNEKFAKVIINENDIADFLRNPPFYSGNSAGHDGTLIYTEKPVWVLEILRKNVKIVIAGGGIVFNERDELLMIHRKGKWDLAKGKVEAGEKIVDGAMREVEEETGVHIESVAKQPIVTYHAYILKEKKCLKETSWFEMKAKPGQDKLVPQTEEQIDEVRWVKKGDLPDYEEGSYPMIWDLIKQIK